MYLRGPTSKGRAGKRERRGRGKGRGREEDGEIEERGMEGKGGVRPPNILV